MTSVVAGTAGNGKGASSQSPAANPNPNPLNPTGLPRPVAPLLPQLEEKTDLGQFLLKFACKGEVRKFHNLQVRYSHFTFTFFPRSLSQSQSYAQSHAHVHATCACGHIHMPIQFSDIFTDRIYVPMWCTES